MRRNLAEVGYTLKLGPVPAHRDLVGQTAARFRDEVQEGTGTPLHRCIASAAEDVVFESRAHPASIARAARLYTSLPEDTVQLLSAVSPAFSFFVGPHVAEAATIIGFEALETHPELKEIQRDRMGIEEDARARRRITRRLLENSEKRARKLESTTPKI